MDADRFFHVVDREAAEIDYINGQLLILANEAKEEVIAEMYNEYVQAMFKELYEEIDVGCEFDPELLADMEAGWDLDRV